MDIIARVTKTLMDGLITISAVPKLAADLTIA